MKKILDFIKKKFSDMEPVFVTVFVLLVVVAIFLTLFSGCNVIAEEFEQSVGGETLHYIVYK